MSDGDVPQIEYRNLIVPFGRLDQVVPSKCRMSSGPTAHTSFGDAAQTSQRKVDAVVPLDLLDHAVPS
jgi:hypothetical protein